MTIEIKELIIKANISSDTGRKNEPGTGQLGDDSFDENRIIKSCVEQVLTILRRERER